MDFSKLLTLLLGCMFMILNKSLGAKTEKHDLVDAEKLSAIVKTLQTTVAQQNGAITSLQNDLHASRAVQLQQDKEIRDLTYKIKDLQLHSAPLKRQPEPEPLSGTLHACIFDVLSMTCPANDTLFVVSAFYGQYAAECNTEIECCEPDTNNDCYGNVEDLDPEGWLALRVDCNYENSCLYQYQGSPNTECGALISDYLLVDYACVSGVDLYEYVGFTFGTYSIDYNSLEQIEFEVSITNTGNHFSNSQFTVPYKGLYMFSLNINTDDDDDEMSAEIMHNSIPLVYSFADGITTSVHVAFFQASNFVIAECEVGDVVWVRCATDGSQLFDPGRSGALLNTFSGALLHRLE